MVWTTLLTAMVFISIPAAAGRALLAQNTSTMRFLFCGGVDGKPCWITEWGFANTSKACPANDNNREQLVEKTRDRFRQMMDSGQIAAAYYFDWDASTYGVWRCGALTPAGKAATVTK